MSSPRDNGKQLPRGKSKKRRHLCIMDTDSSEDGDTRNVKPRRKPRITKSTDGPNEKDRARSGGDSQVAGSSKNEEKKPEERTKDVTKSRKTKIERTNSRDSKSLGSSDLSKKKKKLFNAVGERVVEGSEEKDENNDERSAEHCPICWLPFEEQEVAVPATCDHSFCLQCILNWTAHSNTCPVDRQTFDMIQVHENYGGEATRQMPVPTKTLCQAVGPDEAVHGDNPFAIFYSNSTSSEWDSDLELHYDSSLHSYSIFEATDGPDDSTMSDDNERDSSPNHNCRRGIDSSSTTEDTDFSLFEPTRSDCEYFAMQDDDFYERASSSSSILRQYNSSDSPSSFATSSSSSSSSSSASPSSSSATY